LQDYKEKTWRQQMQDLRHAKPMQNELQTDELKKDDWQTADGSASSGSASSGSASSGAIVLSPAALPPADPPPAALPPPVVDRSATCVAMGLHTYDFDMYCDDIARVNLHSAESPWAFGCFLSSLNLPHSDALSRTNFPDMKLSHRVGNNAAKNPFMDNHLEVMCRRCRAMKFFDLYANSSTDAAFVEIMDRGLCKFFGINFDVAPISQCTLETRFPGSCFIGGPCCHSLRDARLAQPRESQRLNRGSSVVQR